MRAAFYWGNISEKMFGRAGMVDGRATLRWVGGRGDVTVITGHSDRVYDFIRK
jgi:hypothetical protein